MLKPDSVLNLKLALKVLKYLISNLRMENPFFYSEALRFLGSLSQLA